MIVSGIQVPARKKNLSQYITSHPDQLSLVIPSWVGAMSTSQTAAMLCDWGVKVDMVREWMASNKLAIMGHVGALAMGSSHNRAGTIQVSDYCC